MNDDEIIEKGNKVLIKELGYTGFIRYIRHLEGAGRGDQLTIQEDIYKGMSVDEVYEKAKTSWEKM